MHKGSQASSSSEDIIRGKTSLAVISLSGSYTTCWKSTKGTISGTWKFSIFKCLWEAFCTV